MKKGINLLKTHKRYIQIEKIFKKLKATVIALFLIFLTFYLLFYYFLAQQKKKINQLSSQKKELLKFFLQNKELEAKFIFFNNKQKQIDEILKEDVNFFPYYNLLTDSITISSNRARLESIVIDKSKSVNFTLSFESYSDLLSFLRFAESEDFLKNFKQLLLINFSKNALQETKNDYKLIFSGKFIDLNEN